MTWLVEQLPSPTSGPPAEDARYFQCWSSWRREFACWYDREHACEFPSREDAERIAAWWPDSVRVIEVDDG